MKYLRLALITLAAYILQNTALKYISVFGIVPNIMVVFVICYSLNNKNFISAVIYGLLCGFALDCASQTLFGLHALLSIGCASLCTEMSERFFKGKYIVKIMFAFVLSFVYEALYYGLSYALYNETPYFKMLLFTALPTAVYNTVLAMPLLLYIRRNNTDEEE